MTIGDMLVVMNHGQIHQVGSPEACYRRPADTFVAAFLGSPAMNFLDAHPDGIWFSLANGGRIAASAGAQRALESRPGAEVRIGVRPEDVHPADDSPAKGSIKLGARIVLREPLGHETLTHLRLEGSPEAAVPLVARGAREFVTDDSGATSVFLDATRLHIFWKDTGQRIDPGAVPEGAAAAPR
jgi:ABC-type sugar transport system ATPase subunit